MSNKKINIGFAITGSFCTHEKILDTIKSLVEHNYNVIPILSESTAHLDTRFGTCNAFTQKIKEITQNDIIYTIVEAEPLGPKNLVDCLVVAPCTGNTLSKLANAITDSAITMIAKSLSRNEKPIIIGISTNDALGLNLKNLATLLNAKNYFFIPFGQDDCINKPKSLISKWELTESTIIHALNGKQIQPILIK